MSALKLQQLQLQQWFAARGFKTKHLQWEPSRGEFQYVVFATTKNNYSIAYNGTELNLHAQSRLLRPGEPRPRTSALLAGSFSEVTFGAMMATVLTYELRGVANAGGSIAGSADMVAEGIVAHEVYAPTDEGACAHGEDDRDCEEHCECACHSLSK